MKGQNPKNGQGFVFGQWQGGNSQELLRHYVLGTLKEYGGPFIRSSHSVNYLESHDDHTMGDFIRLGTGEVKEEQVLGDVAANARLSPKQTALNKLGALFLFTSRGAVMLHSGQEYARSKVIAPTEVPESRIGRIDHNSYNKDNETNWINYRNAVMNRDLVDYYRGLISIRKQYGAFRDSGADAVHFLSTRFPFCIAYRLDQPGSKESEILVALNGSADAPCSIALPAGKWAVIADGNKAGIEKIQSGLSEEVIIPPSSGMVLIREMLIRER